MLRFIYFTTLLADLDDELMQVLIRMHPLGRLGKPEEICQCLPGQRESSFVTGAHLMVDGGFTASKS